MITIPSVIWTDGNGNERAVDLGTRLLRDRIVLCTGEVTDELAESVILQLLYLESDNKKKPITLLVSGPGGSCDAGLSIISTMNMISCPVYVTVIGNVASMSAVISVSGEKGHRSIYPNARMMLHTVSSGTKGKIQDMRIDVAEADITNSVIFNHLAECCGKSVEELTKDCDRDFWMSAEEAISYGAIDNVVTKHELD